eukprot:gene18074-11365_t
MAGTLNEVQGSPRTAGAWAGPLADVQWRWRRAGWEEMTAIGHVPVVFYPGATFWAFAETALDVAFTQTVLSMHLRGEISTFVVLLATVALAFGVAHCVSMARRLRAHGAARLFALRVAGRARDFLRRGGGALRYAEVWRGHPPQGAARDA